MGFFHFLSDRDRNENNPSRSRTDDHPPQASILDRYPDRQSCLQTIALLCSQERTLRISVDSKLSLPFGGPPCGSQTIHPNFRLFQNPNRFIENGGENRYLPRRNLLSTRSGLREKSTSSDDFKISNRTGISNSLYSCWDSLWREVRLEKTGGGLYWFPSLCREGVGRHPPDASSDGRDQSPMSAATM